jgi:hypothetical protein
MATVRTDGESALRVSIISQLLLIAPVSISNPDVGITAGASYKKPRRRPNRPGLRYCPKQLPAFASLRGALPRCLQSCHTDGDEGARIRRQAEVAVIAQVIGYRLRLAL